MEGKRVDVSRNLFGDNDTAIPLLPLVAYICESGELRMVFDEFDMVVWDTPIVEKC